MPPETKDRIIVALDVPTLEQVGSTIEEVAPYVGAFKIGIELINSPIGGSAAVTFVQERGGKIFYDGKFDDIPRSVAAASRGAAAQGVQMFNVKASCGIEAMMAAVENAGESLVLAVTVLTSLSEEDAYLIFGAPSKAKVLQFARDAKLAGMHGIICSPQELAMLGKHRELTGLLRVTPGVRPEWAPSDDQNRVMTPGEAIKAGADYLVIGRPILKPPAEIGDSVSAAKLIIEEIDAVLQAA